MRQLFSELQAKGSYITENYNNDQFEEILKINYDNLLIPLNYIDQTRLKKTNLKLLVFQNEYIFSKFQKWVSDYRINEKEATKIFHLYPQGNIINNTFIMLVTRKTENNYFMYEYNNLIIEMLNKISLFIKTNTNDYKNPDGILKELKI
ncbi:hypothetical protein [Flavobacterium sp. RSSB_23]|uniref:hypothetical protein n=1 Tax=Flavobacterium sp. RSSB_23 TaxID=3447668 RepID=UPI003F38F879